MGGCYPSKSQRTSESIRDEIPPRTRTEDYRQAALKQPSLEAQLSPLSHKHSNQQGAEVAHDSDYASSRDGSANDCASSDDELDYLSADEGEPSMLAACRLEIDPTDLIETSVEPGTQDAGSSHPCVEPGINVFDVHGTRITQEDGSVSFRCPVSSSLFEGEMLLVFRSPDAQSNGRYHTALFEGKQRIYTFQIQGRFKRKPRGPVTFQASVLDDTARLGAVSRRLASVWLGLAQALIPSLALHLEAEPNRPMGVSCVVDPSWLAILETPKNQTPPALGSSLPGYKECVERNGRDLGALQEPDLDSVYTIEYYTKNLDFITWKLTGLGPLPQVSLSKFAPGAPVGEEWRSASGFSCYFREGAPEGGQREDPEAFQSPPPQDAQLAGAKFIFAKR